MAITKKNLKSKSDTIENKNKNENKDNRPLNFFLNLFSVISFVWIIWAIYTVYNQLINYYTQDMPDIFARTYIDVPLRYGIASLIVIVPFYLIIVNILHIKYKKNELKKNVFIYRWLSYLILFIALIFFIFYLIQFIGSFLNGIISFSVILRFLLPLFLAALVFGYYFYDLKRKDYTKKSLVTIILTTLLIIATLFGVIFGFVKMERPKDSKNRLIDQKMAEIMSNVSHAIFNFYYINGKIGDNLEINQLVSTNLANIVEENIKYRKVSEEEFELCVNFKTNSYEGERPPMLDADQPWIFFKSGLQCYTINAKNMAEKYYGNEEIKNQINLDNQNFSL